MNWENEDERAIFANYVCKMHLEQYELNVYEAADNLRNIYELFNENVRNIYELTTSQLPMFALFELIHSENLDDWCESVLNKDKQEVIQELISDCELFFNEIIV